MGDTTDAAQHSFDALFGPEFGHGKAFDLAKLKAVLLALGDPQAKLPPLIHVAGTNGKGSTIAFMRAIAEAAGLRVHTFTKPHLFKLNERFFVAGVAVDDERLIDAARRIAAVDRDITQFDAQVAAALLLFSQTPADLSLLETGMGGRDDSTNVIAAPAVSVIAPIGLDHQDVLGGSLAEIADHKAGIIKAGAPVVVARQPSEALAIIEDYAARACAPLLRCGIEWDAYLSHGRLLVQTATQTFDLPQPALVGAHQRENAGLACVALLQLDKTLAAHFGDGIASARWLGRLQPITRSALAERAGDAELWVDGGHNVHAANALANALADMHRRRPARTAIILGLRARKNWRAFVEVLSPSCDLMFTVPLPDGADPAVMAQSAGATAADDLPSAVDAAVAGGAGRILICGSLSLAAMALEGSALV